MLTKLNNKKFDPSNKLYCPCCGIQNCDTVDIETVDTDTGNVYQIHFECFNCAEPIAMSVTVIQLQPYTDKENLR